MTSISAETTRHEVASYATYAEAQKAVDALSDRRFEVQHLAIVAEGLRYVENITGRTGYLQAAGSGIVSGGAMGGAFLA